MPPPKELLSCRALLAPSSPLVAVQQESAKLLNGNAASRDDRRQQQEEDVGGGRRWVAVAACVGAFVAVLCATTLPFGLGYGRFGTRASSCYDASSYEPVADTSHPFCAVFTYPYRLLEPTVASRLLPWLAYTVHQFGQWLFIWQVLRAKGAEVRWSDDEETGPHPNKYAQRMFALNMSMVLLKFVVSQTTYDGLANDVPEFSALYSVALWLPMAMLVRMPDRGLFWGMPSSNMLQSKKMPQAKELTAFVRRNHGYVISFGTTYNFWYHPMEASPGFVLGYAYQLCMILQSSFLLHSMHRNKYWTLLLEVAVLPHSVLIALFFANGRSGSALQFGFGFGAIFVLTQMHRNLGWHWLVRCTVALAYLAFWLWSYYLSGWGSPEQVLDPLRIASVTLVPPLVWLVWLLVEPCRRRAAPWLVAVAWLAVWLAHMVTFVALGAAQ